MRLACTVVVALVGLALATQQLAAVPLLAPGDSIIAIDADGLVGGSSYPDPNERPALALDSDAGTKYLNFGRGGVGLIVTPVSGASVLQSMQLTTANDAEGRDPTSIEVWGTNDAIASADNSTGLGESWSLIDAFDFAGGLELPTDRGVAGPLLDFSSNTDSYTSYKVRFPTTKAVGDIFQIADIGFYSDAAGTSAIQSSSDAALAIRYGFDSRYPGGEPPAAVLDGDAGTKYLNFGKVNSGFIVTPAGGPDIVKTFQLTTANDAEARDPSAFELYGTNDPILSTDGSGGDAEAWTLIDAGMISLPLDRNTAGDFVVVDNSTAYASYKMVFTALRDADNTNSMQIADVQFFNTRIPEPTAIGMAVLAMLGGVGATRGRRD